MKRKLNETTTTNTLHYSFNNNIKLKRLIDFSLFLLQA